MAIRIPLPCRNMLLPAKGERIATPVCGLVRNDMVNVRCRIDPTTLLLEETL